MSFSKLVLALAGGFAGWLVGFVASAQFVPSEGDVWGLCGVVVGCFAGMIRHDAKR